MQIKEVMKQTGMSKKAINYYESKGLIKVSKHDNGYRDYDEEAIAQLWRIKVLRRLDFSISDIEEAMNGSWESVFQEHFDTIDKRIAQCETQKQYIQELYTQKHQKDRDLFRYLDEQLEKEFQLQDSIKVDIHRKKSGENPFMYLFCIILSFVLLYRSEEVIINIFGFCLLIIGTIGLSMSYGPSSPMDFLILSCRDRIRKLFERFRK